MWKGIKHAMNWRTGGAPGELKNKQGDIITKPVEIAKIFPMGINPHELANMFGGSLLSENCRRQFFGLCRSAFSSGHDC